MLETRGTEHALVLGWVNVNSIDTSDSDEAGTVYKIASSIPAHVQRVST
jgi:hypothetical protein